MSDMALRDANVSARESSSRAAVLRRLRLNDRIFHGLTRGAAFAVLALLSGVIIALIIGAAPALGTFGFSFFTSQSWNPVTEKFGALAPIYGTLVTSFIAMLIAVPVGLMVAFFLTELCPMALRRPIGIAIELLAGIPSIIYGIWGLFVFAPFLQKVRDLKPDAMFVFVPSGAGAALMKQFAERGMDKAGIKLIGTGDVTDDDILNSMGDVALGVVTSHHYSASHNSPLNKKFVEAFEKANNGLRPNLARPIRRCGYQALWNGRCNLEASHRPSRPL